MKANRVGTCHKCGGNGPVADLPTGQAICARCSEAGNPPRVSASAVIDLRNATGLSALKCHAALVEAGGDVVKAKQALIREALERLTRPGDMTF
jgi:hypothetical protein